MAAHSSIIHLSSSQVNRETWDRCIGTAPNGLVYAYSAYLDRMADQWDALIFQDYEMVMPLPWRKKLGIHYIYQPYFVAQLGLFGKAVSPSLLEDFLRAIPKKFRYWDFSLNHGNVLQQSFPLSLRSNYVLPLHQAYDIIASGYRDNIRRNIKKAFSYGCEFREDIAIEDVIGQARQHGANEKIGEESFRNFSVVFSDFQKDRRALACGVTAKDGQLLASCAFFFSHQRAYYVLVGNHPNGRTLGASHMLIDGFIRQHAGKDLLLDFEGSDIRNLAFFYSSFGATEEKYASIKQNRLPFYMKWIKSN